MLSLSSVLRLARRGRSLTWAPSVCGASPAHSRRFASQDNGQTDALAEAEQPTEQPFDAAAYSAPYSVHQLIGDPRTGIADDTTTAPWGDDLSVEWVWSDPDRNQDWYRYSTPGPVLPYMYMDSRLSDHSKNLLYMLRCKDPERCVPAFHTTQPHHLSCMVTALHVQRPRSGASAGTLPCSCLTCTAAVLGGPLPGHSSSHQCNSYRHSHHLSLVAKLLLTGGLSQRLQTNSGSDASVSWRSWPSKRCKHTSSARVSSCMGPCSPTALEYL